jgi:hypothetical protein
MRARLGVLWFFLTVTACGIKAPPQPPSKPAPPPPITAPQLTPDGGTEWD